MPSIRDLMERFRPAGAPGPAAVAVPADRRAEIVAELEPVFARLTGVEAEAQQIIADAELDARRTREAARLRASVTVATARRRMRGRSRVTACFFGDGAVAEGEFHECLNLAALWHLPVLFLCENNRYAMGTPVAGELAETDLALRAASYGLASWPVDGMDVRAVHDATLKAAEAVRCGGGPHFLELLTYRFRAHSMYDPDRYRSKAEIEEWKTHDPIDAELARLRTEGQMSDQSLAIMEKELAAEFEAAVEAAEAAPLEPVEDLTRFVYAEKAS